jgi:hypothetical protein
MSVKNYSGKKPRASGWREAGVVEGDVRWLVFVRENSDSEWTTVKVVADGRAPAKANYWLGWNGSRFGRHADLVSLAQQRPAVLEGVEKGLRSDSGCFTLAVEQMPIHIPQVKRLGRVEIALLRAADELSLVADSVSVEDLVAHAIAPLAAAEGRDTRRQTALRAVQSLSRSGELHMADGRVLFLTPLASVPRDAYVAGFTGSTAN